jgi:DnaJ-class molecular chaperone
MDNMILAVVIIVVILMAVRSIVHHNMRTCPRCKGAKKVRSSMFESRYRVCPRCGGSGEIRAAFGRKS